MEFDEEMIRKRCYLCGGGISMVELLMALSVIAVLASVATLSFRSSVAQAELQQAADRLIADLRLVRNQALTDQQSYTVLINTTTLNYQVTGVKGIQGPQDISVNLAAAPYRLTSIILDFDEVGNLTFDARGTPSPKGTITLYRGSKQITITINGSGQIEQAN